MNPSKTTTLHQILLQRKQCLNQLNEENHLWRQLTDQLYQWEEDVRRKLKKFVEEKLDELKEKRLKIVQEQLNDLDELYHRSLNDQSDPSALTRISKRIENDLSKLQVRIRKSIDWNEFLHIENHSELLSNLSYRLISTISIQSNINPLLACDERILIYFDHQNSLSTLQIVDQEKLLSQTNVDVKLRVPCHEFQGKILHLEYSSYHRAFLLATGSKLFLLQITTNPWIYRSIEYFDFVRIHLTGILQKFSSSISSPKNLFLLLKIFNNYRLTQFDMSEDFQCRNQWDYPFEKDFQSQRINDFLLGHDQFIFSVTIQTSSTSFSSLTISNEKFFHLDEQFVHQIHLRSFDMKLTSILNLSPTISSVRLALIPSNSSIDQILSMSTPNSRLSLYTLTPQTLELIDEMILDSEPQSIAFSPQNHSFLFVRKTFHIGIYQRDNSP